MMEIAIKCYMSLLEKYNNRNNDKQYNDLKQDSNKYIKTQQQQQSNQINVYDENVGVSEEYLDTKKFNVKMFNKIYEKNKLWDSNDEGYSNWLKQETNTIKNNKAPEIFGKKFNLDVFNSTFENLHQDAINNGQIQEYKEPQALVSCSTNFTELDNSNQINNFSKFKGDLSGSGNSAGLVYTDLKQAYGENNTLHPGKVNITTYKNIEDLKHARSKVEYNMTPEQLAELEFRKKIEQEQEQERIYKIEQRDKIIEQHYFKIHQNMLGYKPSKLN